VDLKETAAPTQSTVMAIELGHRIINGSSFISTLACIGFGMVTVVLNVAPVRIPDTYPYH
jgi:hypothetical protein